MITDPNDFFAKGCGRCDRFDTPDCSTKRWIAGLDRLRDICRDMGLEEVAKWGHPVYMHADRNIAMMGAFRDDFRLTFMNAGLLADASGLESAGPNSTVPTLIRFTSLSEVAAHEPRIREHLAELMNHAEKGTKPPKVEREIELPDELVSALDDDPELAEAFFALTPGRQRSYEIVLKSASKPETRIARIAKLRDKIIAGKGANEY